MTLIECLVGLVISSVLSAAACAVLLSGSRVARQEAALRDVRQNVQASAAVLRAELQSLFEGDLLAVTDSSVLLRAGRGFGVVCATPSAARIVLSDSTLSLLRAIDPTRDSVRVLAEGDPLRAADDQWLLAAVTFVARGTCADGLSGTALVLAGPAASRLSDIREGAPVRLFEVQEYRSYRDGAGVWWLGVRAPLTGGGWASTSPIAGPLRPRDGLRIRAFDSSGAVVSAPDSVAMVELALRVLATDALPSGRRPADSLVARVAVGPLGR